jgi:hypothetical protein
MRSLSIFKNKILSSNSEEGWHVPTTQLYCDRAILIIVQTTLAFGAGVFSGHWKGEWRNSLGESGADSLIKREHRDGTLNGLWTGEVEVSGNRINSNTIELRGQTATRSYQITATLDGDRDEMDLKYIVT